MIDSDYTMAHQCFGWHYTADVHPAETEDVPQTFDPSGEGWELIDNSDGKFHPLLRKVWLCPGCIEKSRKQASADGI